MSNLSCTPSPQNCRIRGRYEIAVKKVISPNTIIDNILKIIDGKAINRSQQIVVVTKEELLSNSRKQHLPLLRFIAMVIMRNNKITNQSIGDFFRHNHTLSIHAQKTIQDLFDTEEELFMYYYNLIAPSFGWRMKKTIPCAK